VKSMVSIGQFGLAASEPGPLVSAVSGRAMAYLSLTKPRLVVLVLATVAAGFFLGARWESLPVAVMSLAATLVGTALVAGGAGALNQWLERDRDALMRRTAGRALPSGRIAGAEALLFGGVIVVVGTVVLLLGAGFLAALVAFLTAVLYVCVYTPLKTRTTLNTLIGAIPGALPPLIGWAAAAGRLGPEAWTLFLIVFLWQFPHFLAIAWIYREDYRRAGFRMLTGEDARGRRTGCQAFSYALVLVPAGLLPATVGLAGPVFSAGALLLGLVYLTDAARFWLGASDSRARRLLYSSFLYLPAILILLLVNPLPY
jgi:protoheme IX farnesyltransferase